MVNWHKIVSRNSRQHKRIVCSKSENFRRRRSRCPSSRRSVKNRHLVRKRMLLRKVEEEILLKWSQKWGNNGVSDKLVLLGGGRGRPKRPVFQPFNVNKFAEIVAERLGVDSKRKKDMWQSIAQEYYGEIRVDKKK